MYELNFIYQYHIANMNQNENISPAELAAAADSHKCNDRQV